MAATISYQISHLLEKMTSADKDYRFMATNDLMTELQKDHITLDDDTERKVVKTVLRLLEDKNGEVQNLAVRCLAPLTHKIDVKHLELVADTLCINMDSSNEQLRDVSSIALKTVMAEVPSGASVPGMCCVKRVMPKLVDTLNKQSYYSDISVKLESLDIMGNLLSRFGRIFGLDLAEIERTIFRQLERERQALRKRSIFLLSGLAEVVQLEQYAHIVEGLLAALVRHEQNVDSLRCYISAVASVARSTAGRFAPYLDKFVPLLVGYCEKFDDDELKEVCLQAFETFSCRCSLQIASHLKVIIGVVSKLLVYDPNYHYDAADDAVDFPTNDMETDADGNSDDEEEDDDQDEYSDDDDLSWKVRRAAAKCLEAVINYQSDKLLANYAELGPMLILRFKEREMNVKYDVFQAYSALLKQTARFYPDVGLPNKNVCALESKSKVTPVDNINMMVSDVGSISLNAYEKFVSDDAGPEFLAVIRELEKQTPLLLKAVYAQIKTRNLKTRHQCFSLLCHLLMARPNALKDHIQYFIGPAQQTVNDRMADGITKINALHFIQIALHTHHPKTLQAFAGQLTPLVVSAVKDPFYKIASEAVGVAQLLILILRPDPTSNDFHYGHHVAQLYEAIIAKLKIADIDQLGECLTLLLDRLRNEMTRIVTVKAFHAIVESPHRIDLSATLLDLLQLCSEFLRKNYRTLRIITLVLLHALVIRYSHGGLENGNLLRVVKEIPPLISEHDLQISLLSINFIIEVVNSYPDQISDSLSSILTSVIHLTCSSLLHGNTLNATLRLYEAIVKSPLPNKPAFEAIVDNISASAYDGTNQGGSNKQAFVCMAKSIAVITKTYANEKGTAGLLTKLRDFLLEIKNCPDNVRLLATLIVGEIGRIYYDAFSVVPNLERPEAMVMKCFESNSEDFNCAASYALGCLAIGNMEANLPFLLEEINKNPKRQYQLLHALKEVIVNESSEKLADSKSGASFDIASVWSALIIHCDCAEDGIRNVVAECLGKICLMDANRFLPNMLELVQSSSSRIRRTAVNAARFTIVDYPQTIDKLLLTNLGVFLDTIRDNDLQVRRAAIVTLNSAAHNKPKLLRDCLTSLLPHLYAETAVKPELVYEVEMGPFKHIVDDGLDLRKAAFECMYTLSERFIGKIDIFEHMNYMEAGFMDQHDIKLLTFLMLIRLSRRCPLEVLQRLDRFCDLIKPSLMLRPKVNAVKQENEKQEELKRSAVRVCCMLKRIPSLESSAKLSELLEIIGGSMELRDMEQSIEQERNQAGTDQAMETE